MIAYFPYGFRGKVNDHDEPMDKDERNLARSLETGDRCYVNKNSLVSVSAGVYLVSFDPLPSYIPLCSAPRWPAGHIKYTSDPICRPSAPYPSSALTASRSSGDCVRRESASEASTFALQTTPESDEDRVARTENCLSLEHFAVKRVAHDAERLFFSVVFR